MEPFLNQKIMNNDINNEIGQNEVQLVSTSGSKLRRVKKIWTIIGKINTKKAIIVAIVIVAGTLLYIYKGLFIAATANGSPISRFAVISKLEKTSGKQTLDLLITRKLIIGELDKKKITVTDDEVSVAIKKIEDRIVGQGSTLEQALAADGMTMAALREQISVNLRIEKLLADQIQVSDDEINQYIKTNKITIPKGQEAQSKDQIKDQLKSSKFSQAATDWVSSIRSQASIRYFVNY